MISKTIGEGTFGKVKLGLHILTGEKVAVKILEDSKASEYNSALWNNRNLKTVLFNHGICKWRRAIWVYCLTW